MSHVLHGKVVPGLRVGRTLGYPTANIAYEGTIAIESGVYVAYVTLALPSPSRERVSVRTGEGRYYAVAIIGARREQEKPLLEVLLLDFKGDLYGEIITLEVQSKISEIERFETNEELIKKIENDIAKARAYFLEIRN